MQPENFGRWWHDGEVRGQHRSLHDLLHELFHMAQNDPYAPEELFKGLPKDPEQAAEAWAINTWETDGEYVLNQLKEEPT